MNSKHRPSIRTLIDKDELMKEFFDYRSKYKSDPNSRKEKSHSKDMRSGNVGSSKQQEECKSKRTLNISHNENSEKKQKNHQGVINDPQHDLNYSSVSLNNKKKNSKTTIEKLQNKKKLDAYGTC